MNTFTDNIIADGRRTFDAAIKLLTCAALALVITIVTDQVIVASSGAQVSVAQQSTAAAHV